MLKGKVYLLVNKKDRTQGGRNILESHFLLSLSKATVAKFCQNNLDNKYNREKKQT